MHSGPCIVETILDAEHRRFAAQVTCAFALGCFHLHFMLLPVTALQRLLTPNSFDLARWLELCKAVLCIELPTADVLHVTSASGLC